VNFLQQIKSAFAITLALILTCFLPAYADEFHYSNLSIGERPAGMGGAFVAISDDPSGLYYNPAGIVYSQGGNISVSVNSYSSAKTTYKGVFGSKSWERKSSTLLPNFFGIVKQLGKGYLGFSYAVPDAVVEDQDQTFNNVTITGTSVDKFIINFRKEDTSYLFGPSYAREITPSLSIGATIYYNYRRKKVTNNEIFFLTSGSQQWNNTVLEIEETGFKPSLGLMYSPENSKLSFGLSVATITTVSTYNYGQVSAKKSGSATVTTSIDPAKEKRKHPIEVKTGIAYFASSNLLISADIDYYTGVKDDYGTRKPVLNFAVGTEYYYKDNKAIRAGFFTDYSNTPKIDASDSNGFDHLDITGLSLSYSSFSKNTSVTFGGTYTFGTGRGQKVGTAKQDISYNALVIYLATSYSF